MKRLAVELSNNQTIIHNGDDLYTMKADSGFTVVLDAERLAIGGVRNKFIASYNPSFIVRMWDVDYE